MTDTTRTFPTYADYMRSTDPAGFHVKHNNRLPDGTIEIVYTNDPIPLPSPKRQLTQREFIDELAEKENVTII